MLRIKRKLQKMLCNGTGNLELTESRLQKMKSKFASTRGYVRRCSERRRSRHTFGRGRAPAHTSKDMTEYPCLPQRLPGMKQKGEMIYENAEMVSDVTPRARDDSGICVALWYAACCCAGITCRFRRRLRFFLNRSMRRSAFAG